MTVEQNTAKEEYFICTMPDIINNIKFKKNRKFNFYIQVFMHKMQIHIFSYEIFAFASNKHKDKQIHY